MAPHRAEVTQRAGGFAVAYLLKGGIGDGVPRSRGAQRPLASSESRAARTCMHASATACARPCASACPSSPRGPAPPRSRRLMPAARGKRRAPECHPPPATEGGGCPRAPGPAPAPCAGARAMQGRRAAAARSSWTRRRHRSALPLSAHKNRVMPANCCCEIDFVFQSGRSLSETCAQYP